MKKIFSFCLLAFSCVVFGQSMGARADSQQVVGDFGLNGTGAWIPGAAIDTTIEGTTYLFEEWEGIFKIFIDDKKYYQTHNLNYNIISRQLESKVSKDSVFAYDLKDIKFIKRGQEKYAFYAIDKKENLCLDLYSSSKTIFVKDFKLVLMNGILNPLTQVMSKSRYEKKQEYFCKVANSEFIEIDLKKKQILKLLGDKSKLVEKFAFNSKLNFSSESDLIMIFKYYDSL